MGIVKIRTVIQRPALEYHCIALLADDGGCQRPDGRQVRMVERSGKRHAVDIFRILFDSGVRDRQLRHLRMVEQSAIHVYAKRLMGSPPSKNEKRPDFSDLSVDIQLAKLEVIAYTFPGY